MNANEIYEYAQDAFSLIRKTDDAASTAALEIAKAGALVSIAGSLRKIAAENCHHERTCRNTGNWVNHWECSECGSFHSWERPNYCPNCGAKVVSE